jgi:23S rRNA (cytosine1962-C5)-methyltransferase
MISHKSDLALAQLISGLETWSTDAQWTPRRIFTRYMPVKNADRVAPLLHSGSADLPMTSVVRENSVSYEVDFAAGYSHGLFLDQRANRTYLRTLKPKRLLNCFAYTCSFSVIGTMAGAETVSVDLSRKSLDRGKHNFALNQLPEAPHRFVADDTLDLLPKLGHRGEKFDVIILDPPTFSRGNNGRLWQVEQHFEDVILAALDAAAPKCAILLSTNCSKITPALLEQRSRACAKVRRKTADYHRTRTLLDIPAGHGSSTIWMLVR